MESVYPKGSRVKVASRIHTLPVYVCVMEKVRERERGERETLDCDVDQEIIITTKDGKKTGLSPRHPQDTNRSHPRMQCKSHPVMENHTEDALANSWRVSLSPSLTRSLCTFIRSLI